MTSLPTRQNRMNLIQAFRALAALLVVFHHAAQKMDKHLPDMLLPWLNEGWLGVDFFFVLSGFIIFYIHGQDIGHPEKAGRFLVRRLKRIYPLYWLMTAVVLELTLLEGDPWPSGAYLIQSLLLIPQDRLPIVVVAWTLMHELLFYLMFTLVLVAKRRLSWPILVVWLGGTLLNALEVIDLSINAPLALIFSAYNLQFILGYFVGFLLRHQIRKGLPKILGMGILFTILGWWLLTQEFLVRSQPVAILVMGLAFGLVVLGASSLDLYRPIPVPSWLVRIGDASFAIYLSHFYLLKYMGQLIKQLQFDPLITLVLNVSLSTLVGVAIHVWIEKPLSRMVK